MSNNSEPSSTTESDSDSDVGTVATNRVQTSHAGRGLKRTFVHLRKRRKTVPRKSAWKKLIDAGRVKEIVFKRSHTAVEIETSLLANFQPLPGLDMS